MSEEKVIKAWEQGNKEIDLLEMLGMTERAKVAAELRITPQALSLRIKTLRKHAILYEWYTKKVVELKRRFPYLAGLMAPQKPDDILGDEDIE